LTQTFIKNQLTDSTIYFYACYKMLALMNKKGHPRVGPRISNPACLQGITSPNLLGGKSLQVLSKPKTTGGDPPFRGTPTRILKQSGKLKIFVSTENQDLLKLKRTLETSPVTRFSVGKKGIAWVERIRIL
jgi:hypothetical protein